MASNRWLVWALLLASSIAGSSCSAAGTPPKVSVKLYYESLCGGCSYFIVESLPELFANGLIDIVDLKLLPYGNARVRSDKTIVCQHGPDECSMNTVEACVINSWPKVIDHFKIIHCIEGLVLSDDYTKWQSCLQKLSLDSKPVLDCVNGGIGKKLELQYAAATDALKPPHEFVPWVVVDGKPLYEDTDTLQAVICKAYKGVLPKACKDLLLLTGPTKRAAESKRVCPASMLMETTDILSGF